MVIGSGNIPGFNDRPILCDMNGGTTVDYMIQNCCYNAQSTVPREGVPVLMSTYNVPARAPFTREVRNTNFEVLGSVTSTDSLLVSNFLCSCGTMIAVDKMWDFANENWWLQVNYISNTGVAGNQRCCGDILFYRLSQGQGRMASISEKRQIDPPSTTWMSNITTTSTPLWGSEGGCCGGTRPFARLPNDQV